MDDTSLSEMNKDNLFKLCYDFYHRRYIKLLLIMIFQFVFWIAMIKFFGKIQFFGIILYWIARTEAEIK